MLTCNRYFCLQKSYKFPYHNIRALERYLYRDANYSNTQMHGQDSRQTHNCLCQILLMHPFPAKQRPPSSIATLECRIYDSHSDHPTKRGPLLQIIKYWEPYLLSYGGHCWRGQLLRLCRFLRLLALIHGPHNGMLVQTTKQLRVLSGVVAKTLRLRFKKLTSWNTLESAIWIGPLV